MATILLGSHIVGETMKQQINLTGIDGIAFTRTKLGEPVFIRVDSRFKEMLSFRQWTSDELRAIADWMDAHPKERLYSDGS